MLAVAADARAQGAPQQCDLVFTNTPETRVTLVKQVSGQYNTFSGGGVVAHCQNQDVTLKADSAEYYSDLATVLLIGNVHYTETRAKVDSRRMTYYQNEQRLLAEGDVDAVLPSGSTMTGPRAEYFRAIPNVRPRTLLNATGRPHISLVQTDSTGKPAEPVKVVATTVKMDGDSLVYASGEVEIDRVDISARSDSAFLDGSREFARLMRAPIVRGKGTRPFTLQGSVIDVYSKQKQLQRVVAAQKAVAVSDSLRLTSDSIDLRVTANRLDRAFAWGKSRAHAVTPDRDILADSIDVFMPAQRVREVRAVRGAYAQSAPDTAKIRSGERDWLRGDTIVALFDSVPTADTTKRPRVREVVASGAAQSFYHMASRAGDPKRPAINYVRGREITVAFQDQAVNTVTVLDKAAGLYLEPSDSTRAAVAGPGAAQPTAGTPTRGTTRTPARRGRVPRPPTTPPTRSP